MTSAPDPIAAFYESHPYPPPPTDQLDSVEPLDETGRRVDHHLIWPRRPLPERPTILVAGCGTAQAARHAMRSPFADVVGIDVSAASLASTRELADRHELRNLELHQLPIEEAASLGRSFDHVVCTGVLHHLADPVAGLSALRSATATGGAITLMVYARLGRVGVEFLQEYCRLVGVEPTAAGLDDLVDVLRELPLGHPLRPLLEGSADFHDDRAIVDALLNPRERSYSVPEVYELLGTAGLRFGRWHRQAPYLPDCGSIAETPHSARLSELPAAEQHAALELFRGTITRHTVVAFRDDEPDDQTLDFDSPDALHWIPVRTPTTIVVEERLPDGASAVLNRAHTSTDLVMFVDGAERVLLDRIDGHRPVADLGPGAADFVERLWSHDLVVVDATGGHRG